MNPKEIEAVREARKAYDAPTADQSLIAALNANTEAMNRLAVVWEKLHAKAVSIEKNPDSTGIQAAGVEIAKFPAPEATRAEAMAGTNATRAFSPAGVAAAYKAATPHVATPSTPFVL